MVGCAQEVMRCERSRSPPRRFEHELQESGLRIDLDPDPPRQVPLGGRVWRLECRSDDAFLLIQEMHERVQYLERFAYIADRRWRITRRR